LPHRPRQRPAHARRARAAGQGTQLDRDDRPALNTMSESALDRSPLLIRMHDQDNVAVVANDGGLPAGTTPPGGPSFVDRVPQGHKVALADIPAGAPVLRYGVPIGYAKQDIAAGRWVHEKLLDMPAARSLEGLPMATVKPAP